MGVCADLTVTASWDCIAEILDLTPDIPHARGFNATERSGAVTVAAAMAAYTQLGILAFAIYGHDVQNADDALTDDVSARILSFTSRPGSRAHESPELLGDGHRVDGHCRMSCP